MIVSANRPYFCPFCGFFEKAARSDVLLVLDTVQFPRGTTWISRNRFKNHLGPLWLTVPVMKKGLGLQRIDEVKVCNEGRWRKKHLQSLKTAYLHAPYFAEHTGFIERAFMARRERLVDLNLETILYLKKALGIGTRVVLLSALGVEGRKERLLIEACRKLGGSRFLAQQSARKYLAAEPFREAGVELSFFQPRTPVYPQLWGDFVPDLSAFDLLFNCGPKAKDILLAG